MTAMLRSALERTGAAVASFAQVIVDVIDLVFAHPTFRGLGSTWSINQAVTDWSGNTPLAGPRADESVLTQDGLKRQHSWK